MFLCYMFQVTEGPHHSCLCNHVSKAFNRDRSACDLRGLTELIVRGLTEIIVRGPTEAMNGRKL